MGDGPVEYRCAQRAGLGHQREMPARCGVFAEGRVHARCGPDQAEAVGPENAHAVLTRRLQRGPEQAGTVAVAFAETGGNMMADLTPCSPQA